MYALSIRTLELHSGFFICPPKIPRNDSLQDDDDDANSYTLTFTLTFPHERDTVYLAHCFPYRYRYSLPGTLFPLQVYYRYSLPGTLLPLQV